MTTFRTLFAVTSATSAIAAAALATVTPALAGGSKEVFIQEYQFDKPMHGYSGHSGNYYCDYQRLPQRKCVIDSHGNQSCRIVGWTLREMCQ